MLAIKNNIMAANAARHLGKSYDALARSVERLASGLRINSAKDDAAGLAVRELIRADVAVLQQGARNAQDGISMIQTMEGAMAVIDDNLIRMMELAEQAATGSYSSAQRTIMNAEFAEMAAEIERIADATQFNAISMLNEAPEGDGSNDVKIHVGTTETIDVETVDMTQSGLDIETGSGGWEVTSLAARGVTTASQTWVTLTEATTGDEQATLTLQFTDADGDDETAIAVTLNAASEGSAYTLAQIVAEINNVSENLDFAADGTDQRYTAAEAYYDSDNEVYLLKLSSRTALADGYTLVSASADSITGGFDSVGTVTGDMQDGIAAAGLNILTVDAAVTAMEKVESAIGLKDTARASFGYKMNRLESTVAILDVQAENLMTAESRISDVDVATEMATLTRTQVLSQAGIAMLAQANAMPQMALTLLR